MIRVQDAYFEGQRHGRNKDTQIDHTYIQSGDYRRKFDGISDNAEVNQTLYSLSKAMLEHRSGTLYEDMYWLNPNTGEVVASELDGLTEEQIDYSKNTMKIIGLNPGLLTIHTHPNSLPPSAVDFNSNYIHNYKFGVISCHNGKVFVYNANEEIDMCLYTAYIQKYKLEGMEEFEAQWTALETIQKNVDIYFREVSANEYCR